MQHTRNCWLEPLDELLSAAKYLSWCEQFERTSASDRPLVRTGPMQFLGPAPVPVDRARKESYYRTRWIINFTHLRRIAVWSRLATSVIVTCLTRQPL